MIIAENLTRYFGKLKKKIAVDGVSFEVQAGEVFGFLGHNGAGKTTTVRMLTGQLRPTSGRGAIGGYDIVRQRRKIHPIIGVVFDEQNLYPRITGLANLQLFADLYGVPHKRAEELIEMVGLFDRRKDRVKNYSNGMRQRLLIARALLNDPRVLFLDEPSRGLDPTSAREIRRVIKDLAGRGTTVFLTTHIMDEADALCDRVAFIKAGRLIASGTPREFKLQYGERRAEVFLNGEEEKGPVLISLDDPADAGRLESWLSEGQVERIHSREASLEEVFIQLAGWPAE